MARKKLNKVEEEDVVKTPVPETQPVEEDIKADIEPATVEAEAPEPEETAAPEVAETQPEEPEIDVTEDIDAPAEVAAPDVTPTEEETNSLADQTNAMADAALQKGNERIDATATKPVETAPAAQAEQKPSMGFNDIISYFENSRKETEAQKKAELDRKQAEYEAARKNSRWAGLAEAAASIINLTGAAKGATPMQFEPTGAKTWREKAERAMKEKEAANENYRRALQSIDQQRSSVVTAFNKEQAANQRAAITEQSRNARAQMRAQSQAVIKSAEMQQKEQQKRDDRKAKFISDYNKAWGKDPDAKTITEWEAKMYPKEFTIKEGEATKTAEKASIFANL